MLLLIGSLLALPGAARASVLGYDTCGAEDDITSALLEAGLGEVVETFSVVRMNPHAFEEAMVSGEALLLPGVDDTGALIELAVSPGELELGEDSGVVYTRDEELNETASEAPPTLDVLLGCQDTLTSCGVITFFDPAGADGDPTFFEGMLTGDSTGQQVYESFETLYANLTGESLDDMEITEAGCGIVYNTIHHDLVEVFEGEDGHGEGSHDSSGLLDEEVPFINASVNIILDADTTFYRLGRDTVWSRQKALLNTTRLSYGLIEPLLGSRWSLVLNLESQETWVSGGPDETFALDLSDEVNDSSYYMINHPTRDEVSYFYVGYDLDDAVAGVAGGLCNSPRPREDNTWGSTVSDQRNHAIGQQVVDTSNGYAFSTFHGRAVVQIHELGHMFGGRHENGTPNALRSGIFRQSGASVMFSGSPTLPSVPPDRRGTFFSEANAENIYTCLDRVF